MIRDDCPTPRLQIRIRIRARTRAWDRAQSGSVSGFSLGSAIGALLIAVKATSARGQRVVCVMRLINDAKWRWRRRRRRRRQTALRRAAAAAAAAAVNQFVLMKYQRKSTQEEADRARKREGERERESKRWRCAQSALQRIPRNASECRRRWVLPAAATIAMNESNSSESSLNCNRCCNWMLHSPQPQLNFLVRLGAIEKAPAFQKV